MQSAIRLRQLNITDKIALFDLLLDAKVMRFIGPRRALSESEAEQWFNDELLSPSRFVIALSETDELVGFCGVKKN